jgi:hypothetical protein
MSDRYAEEVAHSEKTLLAIETTNERVPVNLDNFMKQRITIYRDKPGKYYLIDTYKKRVHTFDNLLEVTNTLAREFSDKQWLDGYNLAMAEERKNAKPSTSDS